MTERKRMSLAEMARQTAENSGWACPRCGCLDWRTVNSYYTKTDQSRHRRQSCRNCGYMRMTAERPIGAEENSAKKPDDVATNGNSRRDELTDLIQFPQIGNYDTADDTAGSDRKRRTRA